MVNQATINVGVKYNVDQSGLKNLQNSLKTLMNSSAVDLKLNTATAEQDLKKIQGSARELDKLLSQSFNKDLGTINITKFNNALKNSHTDLQKIQSDLALAGNQGTATFRNFASQVLTTNLQLKETHKWLNSMGRTMINTIKWTAASAVMNSFTGAIQEAYGYVKNLDSSLNDIRIVTGKSSDEMARFAQEANKAAKGLGAATTDYTKASLIYYQQGLSDDEVKARTNTTLKAANVTGQSTSEVSEQLTAVWNGYKVSANEAEKYVDKLAAVAATTASDLEELSTGMSKVASAANSMGVDVDQLNAQIATIISVTRQAPESVGTALKTIYARLGDLKVDGVDEFGTKLGEVSGQMKQMGIEVTDEMGNLRDIGTVIEETAAKWDTWTKAQKQAAAVAMAGKRQYNNLVALFDNWDMYTESLKTSQTALGTLQRQQDIYMDSMEAHLQQLETAKEGVIDSLFDTKGFKDLVDVGTDVLEFIEKIIDGLGGIGPILNNLGGIAGQVFSKQIGSSIVTTFNNFKMAKEQAIQLQTLQDVGNFFVNNPTQLKDVNELATISSKITGLANAGFLSQEQFNQYQELLRTFSELNNKQDELNQKIKEEEKNRENNNIKVDELQKKYEKAHSDRMKQLVEQSLQEKEVADLALINAQKRTDAEKATLEELKKQIVVMQEIAKNNLTQNLSNISGAGSGKIFEVLRKNNITNDYKNAINNNNTEDQVKILNKGKQILEQEKVEANIIKKATTDVSNVLSKLNNEIRHGNGSGITNIINELQRTTERYNEILQKIQESEIYSNKIKEKAQRGIINIPDTTTDFRQNTQGYIADITSKINSTKASFVESSVSDFSLSNENIEKMIQNLLNAIDSTGKLAESYKKVTEAIQEAETVEEKASNQAIQANEQYKQVLSERAEFQKQASHLTEEELQEVNALKEKIEEQKKVIEELTEKYNKLEGQLETNANILKQQTDNDMLKQLWSSSIKAFSAITQLNGAIQSLGNMIKIINSDDSTVNKIKTISSSLLTLIPMILISINSIKEAYSKLAVDVQIKSVAMSTAIEAIPIIGWVLMAVSAITTLISVISDLNEQNNQKFIENQKKILNSSKEIADSANKEKENVDALIQSYENLQEQYNNREIGLDRLRSRVFELCMQYGLEDEAVKTLSASYDELTESVKKAQIEQNKETFNKNQDYINSIEEQANSALKNYGGAYTFQWATGASNESQATANKQFDKIIIDYQDLFDSGFIDTTVPVGENYTKRLNINVDKEGYLDWYLQNQERLSSLISDFTNVNIGNISSGSSSEFFNDVMNFENFGLESWDELKNRKIENLDILAQIINLELTEEDLQDYQHLVEKVNKKIKEFGVSLEDSQEVLNKTVLKLSTEDEKNVNFMKENKLFNSFKQIEILTSQYSEQEIVNLINGLSSSNIDFLSKLDDNSLSYIFLQLLKNDVNTLDEAIEKAGLTENAKNIGKKVQLELVESINEGRMSEITSGQNKGQFEKNLLTKEQLDLLDEDVINLLGYNKEKLLTNSTISEQDKFLEEYFNYFADGIKNGFEKIEKIYKEKSDSLTGKMGYVDLKLSQSGKNKNGLNLKEAIKDKEETIKSRNLNNVLLDDKELNKVLAKYYEKNVLGYDVSFSQEEQKAINFMSNNLLFLDRQIALEGEKAYLLQEQQILSENYNNSLSDRETQLAKENFLVQSQVDNFQQLMNLRNSKAISDEVFKEYSGKYFQLGLDQLGISAADLRLRANDMGVSDEVALSFLTVRDNINKAKDAYKGLKDYLDKEEGKPTFEEFSQKIVDESDFYSYFNQVRQVLMDITGKDSDYWNTERIYNYWKTVSKAFEGGKDNIAEYNKLMGEILLEDFAVNIEANFEDGELKEQIQELLKTPYELNINGHIDQAFVTRLAGILEGAGKSEEEINNWIGQFGYSYTKKLKDNNLEMLIRTGSGGHATSDNTVASRITENTTTGTQIGKLDLTGKKGYTQQKHTTPLTYKAPYKEHDKDPYDYYNRQLDTIKNKEQNITKELEDQTLDSAQRVEKMKELVDLQKDELEIQNLKSKELENQGDFLKQQIQNHDILGIDSEGNLTGVEEFRNYVDERKKKLNEDVENAREAKQKADEAFSENQNLSTDNEKNQAADNLVYAENALKKFEAEYEQIGENLIKQYETWQKQSRETANSINELIDSLSSAQIFTDKWVRDNKVRLLSDEINKLNDDISEANERLQKLFELNPTQENAQEGIQLTKDIVKSYGDTDTKINTQISIAEIDKEKASKEIQTALNSLIKDYGLDLDLSGIFDPEGNLVDLDKLMQILNTDAKDIYKTYGDDINKAIEEWLSKESEIDGYKKSQKQSQKQLNEFIDIASKLTDKFMNSFTFDEIDAEIKQCEKELKILQREQSRLQTLESRGYDTYEARIDNLEKQKALILNQISLEENRLAIQKEMINAQMALIQAYIIAAGLSTQLNFNEQTGLFNVSELYTEIQGKIEGTDEEQKALYMDIYKMIPALQALGKEYANINNTIDNYKFSVEDVELNIDDEKYKRLEKEMQERLKKFHLSVDLELDLAKAERDWHDYLKRVYEGVNSKDILGQALNKAFAIDHMSANDVGILNGALDTLLGEFNTILVGGESSLYGKDIEALKDDMQKYMNSSMETLNDIQDKVDEIIDAYYSMIDKVNDKLSDQLNLYKQITSIVEHNKNLTGLLYGDDEYEAFDRFYEQQEKNNLAQAAFARQTVDFWRQQMDSAKVGSEEWEKFKANWISAVNDLNSIVEDSVQNIIDRYSNAVEETFNNLEKSLSNGLGLEKLKEQWDLQNREADRYLDTVNAAYEVDKLKNKFVNTINDTTSLKNQEALRKVMDEQLGILQKKEKISKYDIERANALYDIEVKRQALEEAKNNRTTMRLRRDAEGNYRYQYVADEDKIAEAQQALADAQNSLYNLDKDRVRETQEEVYNITKEFLDKRKELQEEYRLADENEKQAVLDRMTQMEAQYNETIRLLTQDNEDARQNLQESTFDNLVNLTDMTIDELTQMGEEEKDILMTSIVPNWNDGIQQMINTIAAEGGLVPACSDAFAHLDQLTIDYQESLNKLQEVADVDFSKIRDEGLDPTIDKTQELIEQNSELIDAYEDQMETLKNLADEVSDLADRYKELEDRIKAVMEALGKSVTVTNEDLKKTTAEVESKENKTGVNNTEKNNKDNSKNKFTDPAMSLIKFGLDVAKQTSKLDSSWHQGGGIGWLLAEDNNGNDYYEERKFTKVKEEGNTRQFKDDQGYIEEERNIIWDPSSLIKDYKIIKRYDTGGYTGDWGDSSGRLAMLHSKELVLNAQDTENILSAVNIVREVGSVLSTIERTMGAYIPTILSAIVPSAVSGDSLEQNVHIDAHFPNVTQSSEIEDAFNNLVNLASQRALRNNR